MGSIIRRGVGLWCLLACWAGSASAADVVRDVGFTVRAVALKGGRIHLAPGQVMENGTLLLRDGLVWRILAPDVVPPPDAEILDVTGLVVYPGFIDAGTSWGLDPALLPAPQPSRPIEFNRWALAATPTDNRKGLTPELEATKLWKPNAGELEQRRKAGLTLLHLVPSGRLASGQAACVTTTGAPLRESLFPASNCVELQLFGMGEAGYPNTLMGGTAHLRQALLDALWVDKQTELFKKNVAGVTRPVSDPALTALSDLLHKYDRALFLANTRDEIHRALDFAREHNLRAMIWGGRDARECVARLAETETPVLLQVDWGDEPKVEPQAAEFKPEIKDPTRVQQDRLRTWKERTATPEILRKAGVKFAFSSRGLNNPLDFWKGVRHAIAAGLPADHALAAVTRDSAALLGQDVRLGELSPGKLAHVVVLTGSFDNEKSVVKHLFADGLRFDYHADAKPVPPPEAPAPTVLQVAGEWAVQIESGDGGTQAKLKLTQSGGNLGGTFDSPQGSGRVTKGTATVDALEWTISIGAGDKALELKFQGKPVADMPHKFSGTLKTPFGMAPWTATRTPPPAPPAATVELRLEADPPAVADQPKDSYPSELESDRRARPIRTGGNVLIRGATVLTGRGQTLPNTSILVKDGKIAALGPNLTAEGITVIDVPSAFVMPGIIDTHSHIMMAEGINEATVSLVPEVRVKDILWTDDASAYRALAGGVTMARIFHGSANVVGGQDAVVKLKYGEPAAAQLVADAPQGVKFALGENVKFQNGRFPNTRLGVEATLNRAFLEALDYRREWQAYDKAKQAAGEAAADVPAPRRDLRLEALMDIVNQQKFIHSHCYRSDEILMLLRTASNLGIRVWSLQHVLEGYKVAPEIVAHGASCSTFADWWAYKVEAFDATPFNAALLQEAGANVVIKSDDWELIRHLYQEAAKTVRYGNMHPDHALAAITFNPARELGLSDRMGSIEVGKEANLAIFNAHPLHAFARCEYTLIDGDVYFARKHQPTAMSPDAIARSAAPAPLEWPAAEVRARKLDLAPAPSLSYALINAVIHPVDGADIPRGTLLIQGDKIAALGVDLPVPMDAKVLDCAGLHLYPGLIDAGTTVGLVEIGKVRETHDYAETGLFQPDLRAGIAVNPDSELVPVARAGGITTILVHPTGGVIAGQASLLKLAGWTTPEMLLQPEAALQIRWPADSSKERIDQLKDFLKQARTYLKIQQDSAAANLPGPVADPRFEALKPYLAGERPVHIEAHTRRHIVEALQFAEQEKLQIVLTGAADAWKVADEIKKRDVPVILGPVMQKPLSDYDPFDAPYANAGRLHEAGVRFCIRSDSASNSRNAPFEAGMAVAYGLPEPAGLRSVTLAAAEILGIAPQRGSLTAGKFADVLITDGSPLQPTMQIKAVFVGGVPCPPESRQTRFYEKYRARLAKH